MGSMFAGPKMPAPMNVGNVGKEAYDQNLRNARDNIGFNRIGQTDQFGNRVGYNADGSQFKEMGADARRYASGFGGLGDRYMSIAGDGGGGFGGSEGAFNSAYNAATAFSEPRMQRERAAMETRLLNKGLDPSSAAFKAGMTDLDENQSAARNTLTATLQDQIARQALAQRQQQVSELQPGLQYGFGTMGGDFANVPGVQVQNVDIAGLHRGNQQDQWNAYNAQNQQRNAMFGGLGGLFGSLLGGPFGGYLGRSLFGGGGQPTGGDHGYRP